MCEIELRAQRRLWRGCDLRDLVCGVEESVHLHAKLLKVLDSVLGWSVEDHMALGEENDAVKGEENFGLRLVDGADDSAGIFFGFPL